MSYNIGQFKKTQLGANLYETLIDKNKYAISNSSEGNISMNENNVFDKFGHNIPNGIYEKSKIFIDNGYMTKTENSIALTRKGFLMSNTILAEIL